ncbi:MAG: hypothetical protein H7X80_09590, partial [bacterium]|nr:hypothetical protein [Candidatus Kapabacteria bacterium]
MRLLLLVIATTLSTFAQSGWEWQNPLPVGSTLHGVDIIDSATITAVGQDGVIVRSSDGGATWVRQQSGTDATLRAVSFVDANNGWA